MKAKMKVIIALSSLVALTTGFIVGFATWNLSRNVESDEVNRVIYELNYNDQTIKFSPLEFNSRFALTPLPDHENEHFLGWKIINFESYMNPINGETSLNTLYSLVSSNGFAFSETTEGNLTRKIMTLKPIYGIKDGYLLITVKASNNEFPGSKYFLTKKINTFYLFNLNIEVESKVLKGFSYNGQMTKKTHDGTTIEAPTSGATFLDINDSIDLTGLESLNLDASFE